MTDLNSVYLYGHIVKDAEIKKLANDINMTVFSIANNYSYKSKEGEWIEKTNYFMLKIYGKYAESMIKYLKKGQKIIIEGFLKQNKWEKDGIKHSENEIGVRRIRPIFDSKKNTNNDSIENGESSEMYDSMNVTEEGKDFEFTDEQLAEMYSSENEIISDGEIF